MLKREYCGNRPTKLRLLIIDFFVDFFVLIFGGKKKKNNILPTKILLFNFGHLGDILMLSYMINELKQKFPKTEIHLVAGNWCKNLIENNELFDKIFYVNHHKTNRGKSSEFSKFWLYISDILAFVRSQKLHLYSHSFDFRYSAHNANILLPFLNIEQKIGFGSVGFGGFLDNEKFILQQNYHTIDIQSQGLNDLGLLINSKTVSPKVFLPEEMSNLVETNFPYYMIFPEAGAENKMISHEFWIKIITVLIEKKKVVKLLICGLTDFSKTLVRKLLQENHETKVVDAVGKLSILQINSLLKKASGAITLDSFPAHLASAHTQTFCLFKDGFGFEYFPINNFPTYIAHNHLPSKNFQDFRPKMKIEYISSFENEDNFKILVDGLNNLFE